MANWQWKIILLAHTSRLGFTAGFAHPPPTIGQFEFVDTNSNPNNHNRSHLIFIQTPYYSNQKIKHLL